MLALHGVRFEHQISKCILKREIAVASLDSSAALRFFHLVEAGARRCSGGDEWKETHPLCWGWYYECCCYYCYPCCLAIFVAFVISTIIIIAITIMFTTVLHILNPCCFKDYNLSTASKKSLKKRGRIEAVSKKVVVS